MKKIWWNKKTAEILSKHKSVENKMKYEEIGSEPEPEKIWWIFNEHISEETLTK